MFYLYVKTHNKTGLKYLGKTIKVPANKMWKGYVGIQYVVEFEKIKDLGDFLGLSRTFVGTVIRDGTKLIGETAYYKSCYLQSLGPSIIGKPWSVVGIYRSLQSQYDPDSI